MASHYQVLGVAPSADHAEIRRAYHRAARRWHPDRFATAPAADAAQAEVEMRRVNEAWTVLSQQDSRRTYDQGRRQGAAAQARSRARPTGPAGAQGRRDGIRSDDGVTRIDPRLLDPDFVAARRYAQYQEISHRSSVILRVAPVLGLLGLLVAIFVFTAYARGGGDAATVTTPPPGPNLGSGIDGGDCVTVLSGPSLLARPCDATADGMVIGACLPDGVCPIGTIRDVELSNGAIACLGPPI